MVHLPEQVEQFRLRAYQQICSAVRRQDWLSSAAQKLITGSEALQQGQIVFDLPWDMEMCLTPYSIRKRDFRVSPNGDPEWCYMLSRMEYLHKLCWHAAISGSEEPLRFYGQFVTECWYANYAGRKERSRLETYAFRLKRKLHIPYRANLNRELDVAVRLYALTTDQLMARTLSEPDLSDRLSEQLVLDDESLAKDALRPFYQTSNIGIIVTCSRILYRMLWQEKPDLQALMDLLLSRVACQFNDFGAHVEDSPMYQVQVTLWLLRLCHWSRMLGYPLPDAIWLQTERSCQYLLLLTGPDGFQQPIGDSDRTAMDSFFLLAFWVLQDEKYVSQVKCPDDLCLFTDIPEALAHWITHMDAPNLCVSGEWRMQAAGEICTLRKKQSMVTCLNTLHKSNHSHADCGSVLIYWEGKPLVVDCGRYSYVNCPERRFLKGPKAHAILSYDDSPEWQVADAWVFRQKPVSSGLVAGSVDGIPVVCMSWRSRDAQLCRYVIALEDAVLLLDGITLAGEHTMISRFPLDPAARAEQRSGCVEVRCAGNAITFTALGTWKKEKAMLSPVYQRQVPAGQLVNCCQFRDRGWNVLTIGTPMELILETPGSVQVRWAGETIKITWPEEERTPALEGMRICRISAGTKAET